MQTENSLDLILEKVETIELSDSVLIARGGTDVVIAPIAAWPTITGLPGKDGNSGERGADGLTIVGPEGRAGRDGERGQDGLTIVGPKGDPGDKGLEWEGTWTSKKTYDPGDCVFLNGSSFVCIKANTNSRPPSSNWDYLAKQGEGGGAGGGLSQDVTDSLYVKKTGDTMTGTLNLPNGTASAPSLAWSTNYGYFYDTTNTGIGISIAGTQLGFFLNSGLVIQVPGGGSAGISLRGEGAANNTVLRYSNDANSPQYSMTKSRGTIASPAVIVQNDVVGQNTYAAQNVTGPSATTSCATMRVLVTEPTPSATAMGAQWQWRACALGSVTLTEIMRLDVASGLSMFGANPVIDANRIFNTRAYTVATVPTVVSGGLINVTDESGGGAVLQGLNSAWRRLDTGQIASTTVTGTGILSRFTGSASFAYRAIVNNTVQKLTDAGLMTKLLGLWVHAVPTNSTDALLNWITPGTRNMTITGSPTWTANQGFTGDGATAILSATASIVSFGAAQDNVSVGTYVRTASAAAAAVIGKITGTRNVYLQSFTSGALTQRLNDTTNDTNTPSRYTGLFTLSRSVSTGYVTFLDDSAGTTIVRTSTAPSGTLSFLGTTDGTGNEFSTAQLAFSFIGTALSASDVAALRGIMVDYYLVQIGAVTASVSNLPAAGSFAGQSYYISNLGGGAGMIQSDGTNWFRMGYDGYQAITADSDATLTYLTSAGRQNVTATLTANRNLTLAVTDAKGTTVKTGARQRITRTSTDAFTLAVKDGGGATLKTIPSATAAYVDAEFNGTAWILAAYGTL